MGNEFIKELEERHKKMMEFSKNYTLFPKVYADGIIEEYQRLADQNKKFGKVTKYKKIKIYRKN